MMSENPVEPKNSLKHADKIFLGFVAVALISFGAPGLYSSFDFYTLWGIHPKWEWASTEWFVSGGELPARLNYQSIFGSLLGKTARAFSPEVYPDYIWVLFIGASSLFLFYRFARKLRSNPACYYIVAIFFLLIKPFDWQAITWGGYTGLSLSLSFALGVFHLRHQNFLKSFCFFLFCLLLKPVSWPLIFVVIGAQALTIDRRGTKYFPPLLATIGAILASYSVTKLTFTPSTEASHLHDIGQTANWNNFFTFPFAYFKQQNFSVLIVTIAAYFSIQRKFLWALIALGGVYLTLVYTLILPSSPFEPFASSNRYALPFIFAAFLLLLFELAPKAIKSKQLKALRIIAVILLLARSGEDVPRLVKFIKNESRFVPPFSQTLAGISLDKFSTCAPLLIEKSWLFENVKDFPKGYLPPLMISYSLLPLKTITLDKVECGPCSLSSRCEE